MPRQKQEHCGIHLTWSCLTEAGQSGHTAFSHCRHYLRRTLPLWVPERQVFNHQTLGGVGTESQANRWNFSSTHKLAMGRISFMDVSFGFHILKFECFRGGIFLSAHHSLLSYRWPSLLPLTCLPLISICVGSYVLDHYFLPALLTRVPLDQVFHGLSLSRPIFFLLRCPKLSFWSCV